LLAKFRLRNGTTINPICGGTRECLHVLLLSTFRRGSKRRGYPVNFHQLGKQPSSYYLYVPAENLLASVLHQRRANRRRRQVIVFRLAVTHFRFPDRMLVLCRPQAIQLQSRRITQSPKETVQVQVRQRRGHLKSAQLLAAGEQCSTLKNDSVAFLLRCLSWPSTSAFLVCWRLCSSARPAQMD